MTLPLLTTALIVLSLMAAGLFIPLLRARRAAAVLRAECAALREEEKRFRAVMDNAPFEVVLKDAEGRYVTVNKTWERLYGFSSEEVAGKSVGDVHPEKFATPFSSYDREVLKRGKAIEAEEHAPHPDGTVHDFLAIRFPMPASAGNPAGLGLIAADITERKRAERALRESEEQLRTITDNLPVLIVRWDREQRYRFANKPAERWYGRPASEIVGKTIPEVFGAKAHEKVRWAIEKGLSGEVVRFEEQLEYPDGITRNVEIAYIPDRAPDGEVLGCFALVQDLTERKKLEAELLRKERLAAMGQLTGTVAHELRNPLGALAMSLGVIGQKTGSAGLDLERALGRANRAMSRCETIITELLDFARAKGIQPQPTCLDKWLSDLIKEYGTPEGVTLSADLGCGAQVLAIDRDELRRAVINVLDNACDAMALNKNGDGEDYELSVVTRIEGARLEMIFTDSGPGIPASILPDIMEPLFSTKSFGTGLGLPIVKRIMEEHGGGIEVGSQEGRGARILLWLPVII